MHASYASYLFTKNKSKQCKCKIMNNNVSSSDSDISVDSLEVKGSVTKCVQKKHHRKAEVEILVPFYEKDVLIKVPMENAKEQRKMHKHNEHKKGKNKHSDEPSNYLINKEKKTKRNSYLEIFRKHTTNPENVKTQNYEEVRSLSPEVGDTTRDTCFDEETNTNPVSEFFNTESYNEIYYDKLMNQELFSNYLEESFEHNYTEDVGDRSSDENLRSISEVTQRPRRNRRASVQPIHNMKLGGLGPDMEAIKPRLERARSLQRYSEKVRMENRLKIYKKSVEEDLRIKANEKQRAAKQNIEKNESKASYLQQNVKKDNPYNVIRNICSAKNQSNKEARARSGKENPKKNNVDTKDKAIEKNIEQQSRSRSVGPKGNKQDKVKGKSSKITTENTDNDSKKTPPIHISFLVNVDGMRPSSALKTLEEKHRLFQERVKGFKMDDLDRHTDHDNL